MGKHPTRNEYKNTKQMQNITLLGLNYNIYSSVLNFSPYSFNSLYHSLHNNIESIFKCLFIWFLTVWFSVHNLRNQFYYVFSHTNYFLIRYSAQNIFDIVFSSGSQLFNRYINRIFAIVFFFGVKCLLQLLGMCHIDCLYALPRLKKTELQPAKIF